MEAVEHLKCVEARVMFVKNVGSLFGPFLVPIIVRHLIFRVPKKGVIILTTTHMWTYKVLHQYHFSSQQENKHNNALTLDKETY